MGKGIKWDSMAHEALLVALIASTDLKVDRAKLVENWPRNAGPAPTERAISDHLLSLRHKLGAPVRSSPKKGRMKNGNKHESSTGRISKGSPKGRGHRKIKKEETDSDDEFSPINSQGFLFPEVHRELRERTRKPVEAHKDELESVGSVECEDASGCESEFNPFAI